MKDYNKLEIKFHNSINNLFHKSSKYQSHSRAEILKKIKKMILSNDALNHHFMNFNFKKEYKEMSKTMQKFNSNHIKKKNLITELSKENTFFSKSYSNLITELITKLENKNINYKTISNFNEKYKNSNLSEKNFFYQNPLLVTKEKDMNNFYLYTKSQDEEKDEFLNYSKKILNKINNQYPILKINNIIDSSNKTSNNINIYNIRKERNKFKTFYGNKSLTDRNNNILKNEHRNKSIKNTLKLDKNFFNEKFDFNSNNEDNKLSQVNIFKKFEKIIKNKINSNNKNTLKDKNKENKNEILMKGIHKKSNLNRNLLNKKDLEFIPLTERNIIKKEIRNINDKTFILKTKRIKKLKGSIHIQNIFNDYLKTKQIIDDYKRENNNKINYLYYASNKKINGRFQRNETENKKINKLGFKLFWAINNFPDN